MGIVVYGLGLSVFVDLSLHQRCEALWLAGFAPPPFPPLTGGRHYVVRVASLAVHPRLVLLRVVRVLGSSSPMPL